MNKKAFLNLTTSVLSSSLIWLQMAPLVQAGNMSDGTNPIPNPGAGGNMSDATGHLNQVIVKLITISLIDIRGNAISLELQQALAQLLIGKTDITVAVNLFIKAGIERSLAISLAEKLQGLVLADGTINQVKLNQLIVVYRLILTSANIDFYLNPSAEFLALQAILSELSPNKSDFAFIAPNVKINPSLVALIKQLNSGKFSVGGGLVKSEIQTVLLNLILGRIDVQTAVNVFINIGIRADLAQALAQSFQGLIAVDGSINQSQLILVIKAYQNVISNGNPAFLNNPPIEFLALQAILIELGVNPSLVAINIRPNPGGNISDATGAIITTGDIAGRPNNQSKPEKPTPTPVANNNSSTNSNDKNRNVVIFIASYIGGPFKFATLSISNAVSFAAKLVVTQLNAQGSLTIQGKMVSFESKQIVLKVLIAKNDSHNSPFINRCTGAGIAGNLAQNLAKSLQGLIVINDGGEVTGVDATKLLAALGSYNAIIDNSSPQVLANRPGEVSVVQFSLSAMVKAGFVAANETTAVVN